MNFETLKEAMDSLYVPAGRDGDEDADGSGKVIRYATALIPDTFFSSKDEARDFFRDILRERKVR